MNKKLLVVIAMLLVTILSLSSCRLVKRAVDFFVDVFGPAVELNDKALEAEKLIDFANGADPDVLFESDGWSNGDVFNVVWKQHNVYYGDGIMRLGITEEKATAWLNDAEVEFNYTAGEARSQNYYHYGDYEVSMKPSSNPGTASTFFVCTGPYDLKDGVPNAHDEIDIEFLGKDTTKVQFNFFVDGKGGNEYMYDLGFDASKEFHRYGFRWEPDSITWFVDGKPVYKVTTSKDVKTASNLKVVEKLPSTAGRILTNYWCGNEGAWAWMGQYQGAKNDQGTEYQWIATSAEGAPLNPPAEKPDDSATKIDWSAIEAITPTFESTELYTVTTEGTAANVTYTEVGGSDYKNVEMNITEASAGKNYLHLVVKNNGETPVRFRVNLIDSALVEAGAQNMSTNVSATVNGGEAFTDLSWGGSFFDLAAGETYEIVIKFSGQVEFLQLMPDSSKNDNSVNAGNITVSEIKFATLGEIDTPDKPAHKHEYVDGKCECGANEPKPDDGLQLNFWTSANTYTANGNNLTYNGAGNTYHCAGSADIVSHAKGNNIFTVTITNNGTADSRVRVDIQATNQVGNHKVCNTDATGGDVWTDSEWGGSTVTVPAGQSVTLVIKYDENTERGAVANLVIFADSGRGDENVYSADITLSGMAFSHEHIYNIETVVDPTCTEGGYTKHACSCGDSYNDTETKAAGHSYDGRYCTKCSAENPDYVPPVVEPEHTHSYTAVVTPPTCTEGGYTTYTCSCEDYYIADRLEALGHDYEEGICGVCGAEDPDYVPPIVDTGLQLTFYPEANTGYTVDGNNIKFNGVSEGYKPVTAEISTLAKGNNVFTVTITNNGTADSRVRFDLQGTIKVDNTDACNVSATGGDVWTDLNWGGSTVTVPTGQSVTLIIKYDGEGVHGSVKNLLVYVDMCRGDGKTYNSDITLSNMAFSHEHNHNIETVVAPTCTEGGYTKHACSCGDSYTDTETEATGHSYDGRYCTKCSAENPDYVPPVVEPEHTHSYTAVVTPPSCTEAGYTTYTCSCEEYYIDDRIEAPGHSFNEGICGVCGAEDPDYIPPIVDTGLQLSFWASDGTLYTTSGNNIKYNGTGSTYACVGTDVAALAAGNNTFTVTITNNGTADSRVRVDIQATNQVGNHKVCNTGATGGDVWTDSDWGGSTVTVAAGQSVTLVITYDENTERGAVTNLVLFVDSGRGDGESYTSDVTLSGMAFSKVGGEEPNPPAVVEGEYLSFTGNDIYTLSANPGEYVNTINVTYTEAINNSYLNINTWIQDKAAGKSTVGVTIKNNGTETVVITVKLENGASEASETKVTLAAGETITASLAYDFAPDLLYFFIDTGWAEANNSHAGDVTISGINFQ